MSDTAPFGRQALTASSPSAFIALEQELGKDDRFADVDDLIGHLVDRALRGGRVAALARDRRGDTVSITGLNSARQGVLDERFVLTNQRERGAWFIPEKAALKVGLLGFPATFATYPRFASGIVWEERARADFTRSAAAVLMWSVLEPLFEQLYIPFELRGRLVGMKSRDDQLASWAALDDLLAALCIDLADELAVMRYGGGWGRLRGADQLAAKQRVLAGLAAQSTPELALLYRAHRLRPLIACYYEKAKSGRAPRRRVVTRSLERTLSGFFGGDWLGFLRYLGEEPHPDEEIVTAIPETRLFVGGRRTKTAAEIAAAKGLSTREVELALATFWSTGHEPAAAIASPVEERVRVLETYWDQLDGLHARQAPGMPSLEGVVEEVGGIRIGWAGLDQYRPPLYLEVLPRDLIEKIEQLWATTMLPRWPDRIASEISPHAAMAETFGAALRFWHRCGLAAWSITEGPAWMTDHMTGLPHTLRDAIAELEGLKCPVDPALFSQLEEAETQCGPFESIENDISTKEVAPGITIKVIKSSRSRREGFTRLRDVITRHRKAWADRYLQSYLRTRWESEIREAGRLHAQAIAERGKPPTAKRFARNAVLPTNHWFNGDIAALYAALGEKSPVHPERVRLMPADRHGFARRVFARLGGTYPESQAVDPSSDTSAAQAAEQNSNFSLAWLGGQSLRVIQLEEAMGRPPELKDFGRQSFEWRSRFVADDPLEVWQRFLAAVHVELEAHSTGAAGTSAAHRADTTYREMTPG
jgi:hypothetical protein